MAARREGPIRQQRDFPAQKVIDGQSGQARCRQLKGNGRGRVEWVGVVLVEGEGVRDGGLVALQDGSAGIAFYDDNGVSVDGEVDGPFAGRCRPRLVGGMRRGERQGFPRIRHGLRLGAGEFLRAEQIVAGNSVEDAVARGADVKFFYNLFSRGLFVLAGDRNDGITSADGLRGKQIGVSTADGAEVSFARSALSSVGVQPDEYKFVTIGQEGMAVTAFDRDTIHAFAASFTGIAVLKDRGVDIIDLTPEGLDLFGNGLAVRGDIYRDSPEMVAGFAKAVHKATTWGMKNPEGVLTDGETYNPQEVERRDYARALLDTVNQQYAPIGKNTLGFLPASGWDAWHKSLLETGELDKPIEDLSTIYTNEFVENLGE